MSSTEKAPATSCVRAAARVGLAMLFVAAGLNHFRDPAFYGRIMPAAVPRPGFWIALTGVAEVAGGSGLLSPRLRRAAGWGLVAMLVGFLWVHVDMLLRPVVVDGWRVPRWLLWSRLALQFPLIAAVWWASELPAATGPRETVG